MGLTEEGLKRLRWALRRLGDELRRENVTHGPVDRQRGDCYRDMKGGNENPRHAARVAAHAAVPARLRLDDGRFCAISMVVHTSYGHLAFM